LLDYPRQKLLGHIGLQQPVAVLGKRGRAPDFLDNMYAAVGRPSIAPEKLLRGRLLQMLYSIRSERLLREEMDYNFLFRWFVGLNADESSRKLTKDFVHHGPDRAQRMIFAHPCLRRQITEYVILPLIFSTHKFLYHCHPWIWSTFSAAC
jgi:hypothetical protein